MRSNLVSDQSLFSSLRPMNITKIVLLSGIITRMSMNAEAPFTHYVVYSLKNNTRRGFIVLRKYGRKVAHRLQSTFGIHTAALLNFSL